MEPRPIRLAHVELNDAARRNVQECLDSGMLARGKYIEQFEETVAEYVGTQYAVAVCNGTMADVLVMRAMKELYGWEHVQVPALTFAAQIASVVIAGLRPVFVDLHWLTLSMNATRGPRFDVALLGAPAVHADADTVVDSCETFYRGAAKGVLAATFSFYATHVIGIGEGGMICTDDIHIAHVCRALRDHGQYWGDVLSKFIHPRLGYNAKMGNLYAAIGCGLMEQADKIIEARRLVAQWYAQRLRQDRWAHLLVSPHGMPLFLGDRRDRALVALDAAGIEARRLFSLMPAERAFRQFDDGGDELRWQVAESLSRDYLYVPCHQGMSEADVDRVCEVIESVEAT